MADAGRRRHDAEVVEGLPSPLEEGVALAVALELALGVGREGALVAEGVDLDRVVDDEVDVDQRVDLLRVAPDLRHRVAHRRQVDDRGDAGEVLHQDPGRLEGDLDAGLGVRVPAGDRLDVGGGDRGAVLEPQDVLEQDLDRVGQAGDVEAVGERVEAEDLVGAAAHLEGRTGAEGVAAHGPILRGAARRRGPADARRSALVRRVPVDDRFGRLLAGGAALGADGDARGWREREVGQRPAACSGATATSTLSRSIALTTAAPTCSGRSGAHPRRRLGPGVREHPRFADEARRDQRDADALRAEVGRAARGRSRAGRTWSRCRSRCAGSPTLPESEAMKTRWPEPRSTIAG